jgi:hypothetical protein
MDESSHTGFPFGSRRLHLVADPTHTIENKPMHARLGLIEGTARITRRQTAFSRRIGLDR